MATPVAAPASGGARPERVLAGVRSLLLDEATVAVVARLTAAGIPPVLLKGPVTARRLYPGVVRPRCDTDLLVDPARFAAAAAVLVADGYRSFEPARHARTFARGPGEVVDLHWTLPLAGARPARVWARLRPHVVPFDLHGRPLRALDPAAHACHLAIHAVQGVGERPGPRADLERAVRAFPPPVWTAALALARSIGARPALTAALRTGSPAAGAVADRLGLPRRPPLRARIQAAEVRGGFTIAVATLRRVPRSHRRELLRRWLAPRPAEIAARVERPDVRASTPAGLPPGLRLLMFRLRQVGRYPRAVLRAARPDRTARLPPSARAGRFRLNPWVRK